MMQNIVAIVGRPNVGKSTLFNRIIGHRDAIVHDEPGVTRDRKYGTAEWTGKPFTVIDTGGFVPRSEDVFEKAIREQISIAVDEADAIVFVTDVATGMTPLDKEIADLLRPSQKPIHLVVNKVDSAKSEPDVAEFYQLGLGEPFGLAALGGRQIGDFLDRLTSPFRRSAGTRRKDPRLRIAVIGKPNVGKSSFVNSLLNRPRHLVTEVAGTTRDPIDSEVLFEGEQIVLVDTAGLRKRSKVVENLEFYSTIRSLRSIERCDVAVVLFDAKGGVDGQDIHIVQDALGRHRPVVIAVNKWDLVEKETNTARQFELAIREKLGMNDFLPIVFISALTKQRVTKVLQVVREVQSEQCKRISTSKLNLAMMPEIQKTPPKSSSYKEIKIKYISQLKTRPPLFGFFCNEPSLVQESYRRFLDRKLREHFGFEGVPLAVAFKKK